MDLCFQFPYVDSWKCLGIVFLFALFDGGMIPLIVWILRVFVESAKDYALAASWILRLVPSYCFGDAMVSIASRETYMLMDDEITEL